MQNQLNSRLRSALRSLRQPAPAFAVGAVLLLVIVGILVLFSILDAVYFLLSAVVIFLLGAAIIVIFGPRRFLSKWTPPSNAAPLTLKEYLDLQNSYRVTFAQIIGGIVLATGAYLTWSTLQTTRETEITQRFTAATLELGSERADNSPNIETRLGAIYALERIAQDSPRDHWTIMEILTAYTRENSPWPPRNGVKDQNSVAISTPSPSANGATSPEQLFPVPVRTDIQAIMTVIARRNLKNEVSENGIDRIIDLQLTNLRWVDLTGAHLKRANFALAHLEGADLDCAYLESAAFYRAHLEKADQTIFSKEDPNTDLERAYLRDAGFAEAYLEGADFRAAYLEGADFRAADMKEADLRGADLVGAKNLTRDQLRSACTDETTQLDPDHRADLDTPNATDAPPTACAPAPTTLANGACQ